MSAGLPWQDARYDVHLQSANEPRANVVGGDARGTFEAGGDYQLAKFKSNPENKGKVLNTGFWRYTRHPNYFGDSAVWWGYGFICLAAGSYITVLGSILMTALIIKVTGVALLEKSLKDTKSQYKDYIEKTSAFLPWFPKK